MTLIQLKKQYEKIVNQYIDLFCQKHEVYLDYWIADRIGEIAEISDMCLDFNDIRFDIDTNQPKDLIIDWYWENVENNTKINFYSYSKGLRHDQLK